MYILNSFSIHTQAACSRVSSELFPYLSQIYQAYLGFLTFLSVIHYQTLRVKIKKQNIITILKRGKYFF